MYTDANTSAGLLYGTREAVIQACFLALMLVSTEVGFRLGHKSEGKVPEKTKSQVSTVEAAMLAILGLLLGFTMSMAVSRFEARKQLVLEEANAIGTACLRTQLLPDTPGKDIFNQLHSYVDLRVKYGLAAAAPGDLKAFRREGTELQKEFWGKTAAYARQEPLRASLLLQSLNQVIDLDAARWKTFNDHVPDSVIYVNALVGLLAATLVGYTYGLSGRRQLFSMVVLALAITIVLSVIIDLDRPRSGFIRVSQQPMIDLQQSFEK
jgi:hypothetical protein